MEIICVFKDKFEERDLPDAHDGLAGGRVHGQVDRVGVGRGEEPGGGAQRPEQEAAAPGEGD